MNVNVLGRNLLALAVSLLAVTHVRAHSGIGSASIDDHQSIKQARVQDVLVEVSVPKTTPLDAKIRCAIKPQNLGEQPITIVDGPLGPECIAALVDESTGLSIPFKPRQRESFGPPGLRRRFTPGRRITLQKGDSKTITVNIDSIFTVGVGKYQLTLTPIINSRDVKNYFTIPVTNIAFEIQAD